ncbi:MAG: hypothetical protein JWN14_4053 [Chthonomonadales bacterium]|nr:hypothetical protein [Chthonomonadales bacterium]
MKNKVTPAMIAGAFVVLALVCFGIYRLAFSSPDKVSAENAPDYAKQLMKSGGKTSPPGYGGGYSQNPTRAGSPDAHPSSYGGR